MVKLFRFLAALSLLVWLGSSITISFYVAPSLFSNESGRVENSSVAGDIVGPLLHKMYVTAWVAIPLAMAFQLAAWKFSGGGRQRVLLISSALLFVAWAGAFYSGTVLTDDIQEIRIELKQTYGGYHLAPKTDPERQRFGKLHGESMVILMASLLMGLGAYFCATQLIGETSTEPKARIPS